jgi:hypothetical protein
VTCSRGIGDGLVRKIIQTTRLLGFQKLFLYTFDRTLPMWYEKKFGFVIISNDFFLENPLPLCNFLFEVE